MRSTKSEEMSAILDFLYYGEANIFQENLDSFLAVAEELKLKGLMRQEDRLQEPCASYHSQSEQRWVKGSRPGPEPRNDFNTLNTKRQLLISNAEQKITISEQVSADLQELDAKVKSLMGQGQTMIPNGKKQRQAKICKMCGKEGDPSTIRDHIEAHHLEGIVLPCDQREKTFRCRKSFGKHRRTDHH